jgi:hypothetical protein
MHTREGAEAYLKHNPAIPVENPDRLAQWVMDEIILKGMPEGDKTVRDAQPEADSDSVITDFSPESEAEAGISRPSHPLESRASAALEGGDLRDGREVLLLDSAPMPLMVTGLYGKYDAKAREWEKINFPVESELTYTRSEHKVILNNVPGGGVITLAKPLGAQIVPNSVVGKRSDGSQIELEAQIDASGQATVRVPEDLTTLEYYFSMAHKVPPAEDVSAVDFERFRHRFTHAHGEEMTRSIDGLPQDFALFAHEIEHLSPLEKLNAVKRFIKKIGYYDKLNHEVLAAKSGASPADRAYIMKTRMRELKKGDSALAKASLKLYAGVCADFAGLTAALLRKAGFIAGVATGYAVEDKTVRMKDSHAVAYVLWPGENGPHVILVDATPNGSVEDVFPAESGKDAGAIGTSDEKKPDKQEEDEVAVVQKVREALSLTLDPKSLGRTRLTMAHVGMIEELLTFYWYSPAHKWDPSVPEQKQDLDNWFKRIIADHREKNRKLQPPSGVAGKVRHWARGFGKESRAEARSATEKLITLVRTFLERFAGEKGSPEQAFAILERVFQAAFPGLTSAERKVLEKLLK